MSKDRPVRCRRRHRPIHRPGARRPGPALSRRRPFRGQPAQGLRRRPARRDRHLEPGLARLDPGRGRRHRHAGLPGRRELLAVRAASATDAQDAGRRDRRGRAQHRPDRHRLSVRPRAARRRCARIIRASRTRSRAACARRRKTSCCRRTPQGRINATVLRLPDFYGPGVEASLLHGAAVAAVRGGTADMIGPIDRRTSSSSCPTSARWWRRLIDTPAAYRPRLAPGRRGRHDAARAWSTRWQRQAGRRIKRCASPARRCCACWACSTS